MKRKWHANYWWIYIKINKFNSTVHYDDETLIKWDLFQSFKGGSTFTKLITVICHFNEVRDKNDTVFSILIEKAFYKIKLPFMIKTAN